MIKLLPTIIWSTVGVSHVIACGCAGHCKKTIIWQKKKKGLFSDKRPSSTLSTFFAKHLCVLVIVCGDVKYLCGTWNTARYSIAAGIEMLQVKSSLQKRLGTEWSFDFKIEAVL